ncbi:hypothetical protein V8B97DRAFT_1857167, partial [Scleroderma yunnanense]
MAELACNYYEGLQSKDLAPPDVHQRATEEVLSAVSVSLKDEEHTRLDQDITLEEVQSTLNGLLSSKAVGIDGLPYEFWKWLGSIPTVDNRHSSFKLSDCFHKVFIDVQHHGVDPTTNFSIGWISPLYKKKDQHDITNYCPITLLNSD